MSRARNPKSIRRPVMLPIDTLDRLEPHAERRGVTINELVRRVCETVADENMVDAVLDDDPAREMVG
jgi:hypothetical protein